MKLLFDQNLSPRLVRHLADLYPDSAHVSALDLDLAPDTEVRAYAQAYGFVIVTKDADFGDLGTLTGFPPSVIWIRRGNCSTADIEALLREHAEEVQALGSGEGGVLVLY